MCNCKKKPVVNEGIVMTLIKKYAIDGEKISSIDRTTLYQYYDQINNTTTSPSCTMCWDEYVKQKLADIWIERVTEEQQK